jgi:3'-phosphoadenosine 5'-phosphosulfate (PAPS) 3'-phosphatase
LLAPIKIKHIGGAGAKALEVVAGTSDLYILPPKKLQKWDMCAPDALLKARHGVVTNIQGNPLKYSIRLHKIPGTILTKSKSIHDLAMKRLKPMLRMVH